MTANDWWWAVQVAALGVPAVSLAWILRWASAPGGRTAAGIVAGVFVGVLAGPGVFGARWPACHERLFVGGVAQNAVLHERAVRHAEEILALTSTGVTPAAIEEHRAHQREELKPIVAARDAARREHRERMHWMAQAAAAAYLGGIGGVVVPRGRRRASITPRRLRWRGWNEWFGRASAEGILTTMAACTVPALLGGWLMRLSPRQAIAFGIIMGAAGLAATLKPRHYVACAVAAAVSAAAAVLIGWTPGMTLVAVGLLLGLMLPLGLENPQAARRARVWGGWIACAIALPIAVALTAVHVDLRALAGPGAHAPSRFWWAILIALLWSSDGRWIAWVLAMRIVNGAALPHAWLDAARRVNAGAGVAHAMLTLVLAAAGLAEGPAVAAGLTGAALVEITRGARRWVGRALDHSGGGGAEDA